MGFFGLFGKKAPTQNAIDNQVKKIKEAYAKPEYRQMAMEKLLEWGTPEAIDGLLQRFSVVVQSPHWDEEEKRFVMAELEKRGDLAKEALKRFVIKAHEVTHAIRALEKLTPDKNELVAILLESLRRRSPEDYRTHQSKREFILVFNELEHPQIAESVAPYIDDHNDDVQCVAIDLIAHKKATDFYTKIIDAMNDETRSARVQRHAAQAVSRLVIQIDETKPLPSAVAEDYSVKDGRLVRREAP